MRVVSQSFLGVPSGFDESHEISAGHPVAAFTFSASSLIVTSTPEPTLTRSGGFSISSMKRQAAARSST